MINTETIEHILLLCLYSTMIKNEIPVSCMLIAPAEHGKTEILKRFAFIESAQIMTDFNSHVFAEFAYEFQSGRKRTIIIQDFLRIIKKKYSTQANSLTIINAITEEGWIGKLPLGQVIDKPIHANILTAITRDELEDKRHKWAKIGFMSRFIPVSFSYHENTKSQIREYIKNRIYRDDNLYNFKISDPIDISLPKNIADKIEDISLDISTSENILGFRLQRQLQVLAMASALSNGRNLVNDSDVEIINQISKYINFRYGKL